MRVFLPFKFVGIIFFSVALTGCFGGDDSDAGSGTSAKVRVVETAEFYLEVPLDWETLLPQDFTSEIPPNTLAAFRNNIKNTTMTANVAIVKTSVPEKVSSLDYIKGLLQKHENSLIGYKDLATVEHGVAVADGTEQTLLTIFEGREREDAAIKEFVQLAVTQGKTVYLLTGGYLAEEDSAVKEKI